MLWLHNCFFSYDWHVSFEKKFKWQCDELILIFLYINKKDSLIKKREAPKYIGSIQGNTNQEQKLQKSSKSKIEKGWFLHIENRSNKVRKKRSLRLGIERSMSSKHLLFLSFQIHHIKQRGTTFQISLLWWRPKRPCQQAKSPTIDNGMTQLTPNLPYPIAPKQPGNEGKDGQHFHYYTCTYNTNPKCKPFFSLNCQ